MKFSSVLCTICFLLVAGPLTWAAGPRIAVWDPAAGTSETRFQLDPQALKQVAQWLQQGGAEAKLLTAAQIASAETFSARDYDAVVFLGSAFPRSLIPALKQFTDDGGVLMALGAQVPLLIAIEPGPDGKWILSPQEPKFAWQSTELLAHLGLQYKFDAALHDQGVRHTATALFRQYLPEARDLRGKLASRWITPRAQDGGTIYPLLRSQRQDGADVPPQLYIVARGERRAIISTDAMYSSQSLPRLWPLGQQTVSALARLAQDLHQGKLELKAEMAVSITQLPPLKPAALQRVSLGSVSPEGAAPVVRWGEFDGSCCEFGPALKPGASAEVKAGSAAALFPAVLEGSTSVRLALPPLPAGPLYLRVRGAYLASGAGLKAQLGEQVVLNESLVYMDTSGPGNFSRSLSGMPVEFTRIVYLPPAARGSTLVLSNPGSAALYFDAVQIEQRPQPARQRMMGLGAPMGNLAQPELAKQWSGLRMSMRTQFIGEPGDAKRFDKVDQLFNRVAALNPSVEPILEGTPAWAAISPERLEEAVKAKRPTTVPPDPQKYAEIVEQVVRRYGDRISTYEIWNEADISQFYRGTPEEYVTLFKTIVPIIRRLDPTARVMLTGMAGYHEEFIRKMSDAGVLDLVDLLAFHPYAGKSAGWDLAYGLTEGYLLSLGCDKEIYCNESGFPSVNSEWFQPPPEMTPQTQKALLDLAMARLLADGLSKLSVFNAGADGNAYALFDRSGKPLPAYSVFADYARLAQDGARRLDVCVTGAADAPLQGVYAAASAHADGSATVVLNPAECDALQPSADPTPQLSGGGGWTCFFGQAKFAGGQAAIVPETGKPSAGFYKQVRLDPAAYPTLEITVGGEQADWELLLKQGGKTIPAIARQGAGTARVDLSHLLPAGPRRDVEISFRIYRPTTIEAVRFIAASDNPPAVKPLPVRLQLPLGAAAAFTATLSNSHGEVPLSITTAQADGQAVATLLVPLTERSVIRVQPKRD